MCRAQIDVASVEVRFKNLSVSAEVAVGARGEPTVLNAYRNQFEVAMAVHCTHMSMCTSDVPYTHKPACSALPDVRGHACRSLST